MNRTSVTVLLALTLALGGCVQLTGKSGPVRILAPELRLEGTDAWPAAKYTLAVQRPIADKTRGTSRVIVRTNPARLTFYPDIAWLDEVPEMLQTLTLQGFTDSGRLTGAVRPGGAKARYSLGTEIRRFEAVDDGAGVRAVELQLQAGLLEVRSGRLVASRVFEVRVPVSGDGVDAMTDGFEQALSELIGQLIGWTLDSAPIDDGARPETATSGR